MKLFLGASVVFYVAGLVCSIQSFNYESMHKFGVGNRPIPGVRRQLSTINKLSYAYPEPLFENKKQINYVNDPYHSIAQGKREYEDVRVIRKKFEYPASPVGYKLMYEHMLYCTINYISIETSTGIPYILRGGAGYQHFSIVIRTKPSSPLTAIVKVYCRKGERVEAESLRQNSGPSVFKDLGNKYL